MPARIGFAKLRKQMLQAELERILEVFPQLGVEKAFLVGDLAVDKVGPESSLELIIIHDVPGTFTRRPDFFFSHLAPTVGTSYLIYTPEEFQELKESNPYLRRGLRTGKVVFES